VVFIFAYSSLSFGTFLSLLSFRVRCNVQYSHFAQLRLQFSKLFLLSLLTSHFLLFSLVTSFKLMPFFLKLSLFFSQLFLFLLLSSLLILLQDSSSDTQVLLQTSSHLIGLVPNLLTNLSQFFTASQLRSDANLKFASPIFRVTRL